MPDFREGHFVMQVSSSMPGTSLDEMLAMGKRISADVLALPYVQTIEQQIGRAELGEDTWGPHRSEFHVELKPDANVDQAAAQEAAARHPAENYPGMQSEVVTFLGDRISESLSGETAAGRGQGLRRRPRRAGRHRRQDRRRPRQGCRASSICSSSARAARPTIAIELMPEALAASGLKVQDVLDAVETAYAGKVVGQTYRGTRTVDVVRPAAGRSAQPARRAWRADDRESARPGTAVAGRARRSHRRPLQHRA